MIGHLFYTTLTVVHHLKAICEFILDLQSGNAQFGSKSAIFVPSDLEMRRMTLKNNRAPLLCHFKLCAIDEFKLDLQSGNAQFRSKSAIFCNVWPWNLTDDLEKQQGTSSMLLQALCIISLPSVNRMAWQWAETLMEIRGTLADIRGTTK